MGDKSVTDHFAEFSKLNEEFNALLPITTDVKKMIEQRELLFMMTYLRSLRPEFSVVCSQILGDVSVTNVNEAFARVLRVTHEYPSTVVSQSPTSDSSAMFSHSFGRGRGQRGRGFGDRGGLQGGRTGGGRGSFGQGGFGRSRPRCYHCGEEGHVISKCWKFNGISQVRRANVALSESMNTLGLNEDHGTIKLSKDEYTK
ncbi:uncharacterized protein LOC141679097 [Apium graveolens]|uniref:uncharacterized protein LOC141679097 n=1 Tax=Apium graveolens TaxID=4045 RepID=UPI003D7BE773